jgi:hypothetical protein
MELGLELLARRGVWKMAVGTLCSGLDDCKNCQNLFCNVNCMKITRNDMIPKESFMSIK